MNEHHINQNKKEYHDIFFVNLLLFQLFFFFYYIFRFSYSFSHSSLNLIKY